MTARTPPPGELRRRLTLLDAVAIGMAAMLGAGVFSAFSPAAASAGTLLPISLLIAAFVASANALSTAQLAAQYPVAGGAYTFGRRQLGPWPGFAAGWMFVVGKIASCGAIALTVGNYLWPGQARGIAVLAVALVAAVNLAGVTRTARTAAISTALVVAVLVVAIVLGLTHEPPSRAGTAAPQGGAGGILEAAGLLFFAFAGYARIATLGEEVREPARTIPRAIGIALSLVLGLYLAIGLVLMTRLGIESLAASDAPLRDLVAPIPWAEPMVTAGAVAASLGSLLALLAGISRTSLAMAREGDLPRALARVSQTRGVPAAAEASVAVVVCAVVLTLDLREVIAFSSAGVLLYYLVANLSAFTQAAEHRRFPRAVPVAGALGCLILVATLPAIAVLIAIGLLAIGTLLRRLVNHA